MSSGGSSTIQKSDPWSGVQPFLSGSSTRTLKPGVQPTYKTEHGPGQNWLTGDASSDSYGASQARQVQNNPASDYETVSTPGIFPEASRIYQDQINQGP